MVKAVFFDIDGTLVSFNTHAIPQSALDALSILKNRGVKIFIATGRAMVQLETLSELPFDGYITANGAYCTDSQFKLIHKSVIPREDIEALIRYQDEKGQFPVAFMTTQGMTINIIDKKVMELCRMIDILPPPVKSIQETLHDEVLQLDMYAKKEQEQEIMQKVLVHCHATRWNPGFADINLRGCSKQSGIDHILRHYNIKLNETMGFGDGGNDIAMLRHVATGIAMGNASGEVKRSADYVTDTVDDNGIWNALKHFEII